MTKDSLWQGHADPLYLEQKIVHGREAFKGKLPTTVDVLTFCGQIITPAGYDFLLLRTSRHLPFINCEECKRSQGYKNQILEEELVK